MLKRLDNLDDEKGEPAKLLQALELNHSLAVAYYLKDDLNQFWEQADKETAARFLTAWIQDARAAAEEMWRASTNETANTHVSETTSRASGPAETHDHETT